MLNKLKKIFEFDKIVVWALTFCTMVFLNNAGTRCEPFAASLYFAILLCGGNIFIYSAIYLASFAFTASAELLFSVILNMSVLCAIYGTFGKRKQLGPTSAVFLGLSLIPYVLLGGRSLYISRAVASLIITFLGAIFYPCIYALKIKGITHPDTLSAFSFCILYVFTFIGGVKYCGFNIYKAFSVLLLMAVSTVLSGKESCFFALLLAIPAAVVYRDAAIFAPFLIFGGISFVFSKFNRLIYEAMLLAAELTSAYIFGLYGNYDYVDLIYFCVALLIFAPLPKIWFTKAADSISSAADKPLPRYEINRTRMLISSRLYEISGTFNEIANLFEIVSSSVPEYDSDGVIVSQIKELCADCPYRIKCRQTNFPTDAEILKLVNIAKSRGRIGTADLPKSFFQKCNQSGKILLKLNDNVSDIAEAKEKEKAAEQTRALVGIQAAGIAAALKGTARSLAKTLNFQKNKESKLSAFLFKKGVNVHEAMIYGEGENTEIHLVLSYVSDDKITALLNEFFKAKFAISEKFDLGNGKTAVVFEQKCRYDCLFGVANAKKEGTEACGDTHSLIKLSRDKFMLALSDGMGSGATAQATSSASLSLLECFYRAGLPNDVALSTVNELLSFVGEDNFAALDIAVIDLNGLLCDFIKLGAPYGFIVSGGAIKLIEGSSLPIGILKEIKPSVCTEPILPGDVILFMSDGITDAFGSSTDLSDYLISVQATNPQKLADKILERALEFYGDVAQDDMTVVACKIFAT